MKKLVAILLLMTQPIICSQSVVGQLKEQLPAVITELNKRVKYKISSTTQDIEKMAVDLVKEFPHLSVDEALNVLKMAILWIDKKVSQYNQEVIQCVEAELNKPADTSFLIFALITISIPVVIMVIDYFYQRYKNKQENKQQMNVSVHIA